jgi:homoserine O-acetyltransferase
MDIFELGDLRLASGQTLPDAKLAYQTFGTLSAAKDNAVLFPTFLGAPAEVLNGWIGQGRALDPDKHFVILPGHFGLPPSSAPSNAGGADFPVVDIADDVAAQHRLVTEHFGITELQLVLGWSIGGIQVYEWGIRHPEMVRRLLPIAGAPTPPPWTKLWLRTVVEEPITSGAGLAGVAHASALTAPPRSFYFDSERVWNRLGFGSVDEFVAGFWEGFWLPQDPDDVVAQARKARAADPAEAGEDLSAALARIKAVTLVAAFVGDALFPPAECKAFADAIPGAQFREIASEFGHLATFGLSEQDVASIDAAITDILAL